MNHNLGEVSYDIRFARQKASQDIAAIEAEWNAALARMNSKGVGLSGGGAPAGVASGGYSGQSGANGQPMQGTPMRGPNISATPSNGDVSWNLAAASRMNNSTVLGGGNTFANGQPNITAGRSFIMPGVAANPPAIMPANRFAYPFAGGVATGAAMAAGGTAGAVMAPGGGGFIMPAPGQQPATPNTPATPKAAVAWLKPVLIGAAINAITSELASEATYAKNLTLAGTNSTMRAQAMIQRRKDAFGAIPLVGGSLGTYATAQDEAYLQKTQNTQDVNERFGAVGVDIVGNRMRGRAAGVMDSYGRGILESKTSQAMNEDSLRRERAAYFERNVKPTFKSEDPSDYGGGGLLKDPSRFKRAAEAAAENKRSADEYNIQTGNLIGSLPYSRERAAMTRRFDVSLAQQGVELTERNYNNAMRPGAGAAAGALGRFAVDRNTTRADFAAITGTTQEDNELRGRLKSGLSMRAKLERAGLEGERMEALRNAFGGRPTEIDGMRSVEAMRDISPETTEGKLGALNEVIEKLTRAIENLDKKGGIP